MGRFQINAEKPWVVSDTAGEYVRAFADRDEAIDFAERYYTPDEREYGAMSASVGRYGIHEPEDVEPRVSFDPCHGGW